MLLFFVQYNKGWKADNKNKMDNPVFTDEEDIPLVHRDDDYDDHETSNASRIEASFTVPDTIEATSTLRLRQKVKRDKINTLYRHLNVTGNPDLIDLDQFKLTKDPKKRNTIFEFSNGDRWVTLTKQTGNFFAPKTLRKRFGGLNIMENVLGLDETPSVPLRLQVNLKVYYQQI